MILAARVGKRTDSFLEELVVTTQGKTNCEHWNTDGWGGYRRVIPEELDHQVVKQGTQRLERTNGIVRQQTGRWHRYQNALCQGLAADYGDGETGSWLFQLALGTQPSRDDSRSKGRSD